MQSTIRENWLEALVGLAVIALAAWFVVFAYGRTASGGGGGRYELFAQFPNAAGVLPGTDVRVSGLKVGAVTGSMLDPKSYQARVTIALDEAVKLPIDSSAAITQAGILGGTYVSLTPGAETQTLASGDEITETQGSVDLMGLIGSVVNRTGARPPATPPEPAPAP